MGESLCVVNRQNTTKQNITRPSLGLALFKKTLTIQGLHHLPDSFSPYQRIGQALGRNGSKKAKLKYRYACFRGLESAPKGLNLLFNGEKLKASHFAYKPQK